MVNTEDFIKRLEVIFDYYSLSASGFADKIGVQRSSLSHLLSGRNKPSLDFILKILDVFPEVDLYWILNGKGSFPKGNAREIIPAAVAPTFEKAQESLFKEIENVAEKKPVENKTVIRQENKEIVSDDDKIEKIVIFYSNGKFVEYSPK